MAGAGSRSTSANHSRAQQRQPGGVTGQADRDGLAVADWPLWQAIRHGQHLCLFRIGVDRTAWPGGLELRADASQLPHVFRRRSGGSVLSFGAPGWGGNHAIGGIGRFGWQYVASWPRPVLPRARRAELLCSGRRSDSGGEGDPYRSDGGCGDGQAGGAGEGEREAADGGAEGAGDIDR